MVPPPEPAVADWCDQLVASGGTNISLVDPYAYFESIQVGQASVKFNTNGTYTAGMTKTGTFWLDLPGACVRAFGARDGLPIGIQLMGPDFSEDILLRAGRAYELATDGEAWRQKKPAILSIDDTDR